MFTGNIKSDENDQDDWCDGVQNQTMELSE